MLGVQALHTHTHTHSLKLLLFNIPRNQAMFVSGQLAVAALIAAAHAVPFLGTHYTQRQDLASSYDYVIVGGGAAGLTLANRLTEDSCRC